MVGQAWANLFQALNGKLPFRRRSRKPEGAVRVGSAGGAGRSRISIRRVTLLSITVLRPFAGQPLVPVPSPAPRHLQSRSHALHDRGRRPQRTRTFLSGLRQRRSSRSASIYYPDSAASRFSTGYPWHSGRRAFPFDPETYEIAALKWHPIIRSVQEALRDNETCSAHRKNRGAGRSLPYIHHFSPRLSRTNLRHCGGYKNRRHRHHHSP